MDISGAIAIILNHFYISIIKEKLPNVILTYLAYAIIA